MITDGFNKGEKGIVELEAALGPKQHLADDCIFTFSRKLEQSLLAEYKHEKVAVISNVGIQTDIVKLHIQGREVLFARLPITGAAAGGALEQAYHKTGFRRAYVFGSCGALIPEAAGNIIIPDACYRDEGLSYHYKEPEDYIQMPDQEELFKQLRRWKCSVYSGHTWTTDSMTRETPSKASKRREEGCVCVEMEAASLQAVCSFYGIHLYMMFFVSDVLSDTDCTWKNIHLGQLSELGEQDRLAKLFIRFSGLLQLDSMIEKDC